MGRIFTKEDIANIITLLAARHAVFLKDEHFEIGGRVEPGFLELTAAIVNSEDTFRYEMEIRVPLKAMDTLLDVSRDGRTGKEPSPSEARDIALDFLGYYLDEYFQSGRELLLPLDLQPFEFGEWTVWARGDITNPKLDRMADEIIAAGVPLSPDDPRYRIKV